ncbi:MAG TPA: DUF2303 family protein [Nocardioidaceae bacterium]|nr:DUF2303 family protein [Nocardioidaceae bacterium]
MTDTLSTSSGDIQAAIDAGALIATPHPLDRDGRFFSVTTPDGSHRVIDVEHYRETFRPTPRRKTGTVNVYDAASFTTYYGKHAVEKVSEVWADVATQTCVGVLNGHGPGDVTGWGDHRVQLRLRKTPAWQAWEALDGKLIGQVDFAEHIEDRLIDIVTPPGAQMLELAQTFQANTKVRFESSKRLSSGERQLEYREDVQAAAGRKGDITIPDRFELGLAPFEESAPYKVSARFRYRIADGALRVGFVLERPEDVLRQAFTDVLTDIESDLGVTALRGTPAS